MKRNGAFVFALLFFTLPALGSVVNFDQVFAQKGHDVLYNVSSGTSPNSAQVTWIVSTLSNEGGGSCAGTVGVQKFFVSTTPSPHAWTQLTEENLTVSSGGLKVIIESIAPTGDLNSLSDVKCFSVGGTNFNTGTHTASLLTCNSTTCTVDGATGFVDFS